MKTLKYFFLALISIQLIACNGDDDDILDPVTDPVTEEITSYMIINGDTVPNTTQSINFSDSTRTLFQTNFQDNNHFYAVSYSVSNPLDITKDYTTTSDRFFYFNPNPDDSVNLYISDFNNDLNYISEAGKTLHVVKNTDNSHTISIDNLTAVEEAEGNTSITFSLNVKVTF